MKNNHHKRFGTIAVDKGYIDEDQLINALEIQAKENVMERKHRMLGHIFVEEGLLTEMQVDEILVIMNQMILYMISVGR
jgi:tRNA 2-selenouridine synthase SelU